MFDLPFSANLRNMSDPPEPRRPAILEYRTPTRAVPRTPGPNVFVAFSVAVFSTFVFGGWIVMTLVPVVARDVDYFYSNNMTPRRAPWHEYMPMLVMPLIGLVVGSVLVAFERSRAVGAGLLIGFASTVVGGLILWSAAVG